MSTRLGVQRASIAQWESGRHLPSAAHVHRLDEVYGARGELIALAAAARGDASTGAAVRHRPLSSVFTDVADGLVAAVVSRGGTPLGWSHNLVSASPTPLSTAFVIRTLQRLDDARVDLHAVGKILLDRRGDAGWTNRLALEGRPEVTAVVLTALARLGLLDDIDGVLRQLRGTIDRFARTRPYVLCVVLESVLDIRPADPLVDELVRALLEARTRHGDRLLWTANSAAPADLVEPSLAHTARAVAVLRAVRDGGPAVAEAIRSAIEWMVGWNRADDGVSELLEPEPGNKAADISINHFTAAWCVRALVGVEGIPEQRLRRALSIVWECYEPSTTHLWVWRSEGKFPSWMTHDAVAALHAAAMSSFLTPLPLGPPDEQESAVDPDPDRGST